MKRYERHVAEAEKIKARAWKKYEDGVRRRERLLWDHGSVSRWEKDKVPTEAARIMASADREYEQEMREYRKELVAVNFAWGDVMDAHQRGERLVSSSDPSSSPYTEHALSPEKIFKDR